MGANKKWKRVDGEKVGDVSVSLLQIHTAGLTPSLAERDVARAGHEQHGLRALLYRYGKLDDRTGTDRGFPALGDDVLAAEDVENILGMVEANKSFFQDDIKGFRYQYSHPTALTPENNNGGSSGGGGYGCSKKINNKPHKKNIQFPFQVPASPATTTSMITTTSRTLDGCHCSQSSQARVLRSISRAVGMLQRTLKSILSLGSRPSWRGSTLTRSSSFKSRPTTRSRPSTATASKLSLCHAGRFTSIMCYRRTQA